MIGGAEMFRHDTLTLANEHYWIRFHNGTHEVRHETPSYEDDNETVFTGTYEECVQFIDAQFYDVEPW